MEIFSSIDAGDSLSQSNLIVPNFKTLLTQDSEMPFDFPVWNAVPEFPTAPILRIASP